MLEKPNISDKLIVSQVEAEYDLHVAELTFLPLGADENTSVYRLLTEAGTAYFLKLRKNFEEIITRVPLFLKEQGVQAIIAPLEAKTGKRWANFNEYKLILYPFVEGKDSFGVELSDEHKQHFGAALKSIHTVQVPPELKKLIPQETFSPYWRELLRIFQIQMQNNRFEEPIAAQLAVFMRSRQDEIDHLLRRTEELAFDCSSKSLRYVLCHSDVHGANLLISNTGQLYIVDWDNPILAPKERDLMFIGSGVDGLWKSEQGQAIFYQGYGETEVDRSVLAYYRCERIIEDLAVICEQLCLTEEGGADRERSYGYFTSNFEPGGTLEIAEKTY